LRARLVLTRTVKASGQLAPVSLAGGKVKLSVRLKKAWREGAGDDRVGDHQGRRRVQLDPQAGQEGFVPLDGVGRPHGRAHVRKDCLDRVQSEVEGRALPIPGEAPRRP